MNRQKILFGSLVLVFIAALLVYQTLLPPQMNGSAIDPPAPVGDFSLQSGGGPVTLSGFQGRYVILYFGYTSCPDVCPTTLATLREALSRLGDKADGFQVIFVSVDWGRDTPQYASVYASRFDPTFLGLAGSEAEIDEVTRQFGIFYKINPPDDGGFYTIDHTASTLVLDRAGNLVLTWPYGLQADQIEDDMRALLRR
ncbi:MAG: SCO family protein [Chloroflexi bacterium HGW-Chloroflexi-6]|nr:MAG: SCO family protein [Chloroflexi bacterium HGW-Chloroflexi-6]